MAKDKIKDKEEVKVQKEEVKIQTNANGEKLISEEQFIRKG